MVPDLAAAYGRWPAFAEGAVAAVFSFPLILRAVRLGSLDCYRTAPGGLGPDGFRDGLVLSEAAFEAVLAEVTGHAPEDLGWITDVHTEVHQACGVVMYQLKIPMEIALVRVRAHAYADDLGLSEVAGRIVNGNLSLGRGTVTVLARAGRGRTGGK